MTEDEPYYLRAIAGDLARTDSRTVSDLLCRAADKIERYEAALTPGTETKAAYIGEFHFPMTYSDEDGNDYSEKVTVPWTTIKEIMAAIRAHASPAGKGET